jgi:hypothetical protein
MRLTRSAQELEASVMDALVAICTLPALRQHPLVAKLVAVPLDELRWTVQAEPAKMIALTHEILELLVDEDRAALEPHVSRLTYWKNSAALAAGDRA